MALLEAFEATNTDIEVKFDKTVKVSSITNDKFLLYTGGSTPVLTPFQTISLINDYDTISRRLVLRFASTLLSETEYTFTISGLLDAAGSTLPSETNSFTTTDTSSSTIVTVPDAVPVEIEDHSIRSEAFIATEALYVSNPGFYILSTDPEFQELLIPGDYNDGRITITFSSRPGSNYINSTYFKVQKKLVGRAPSRWETCTGVLISLDSDEPNVYIDFPSTDATPVYVTPDKDYFAAGYKYRIKVSKSVGG